MEVSGHSHAPVAVLPGNNPSTNSIGSKAGPRTGLNVSGKGNTIFFPADIRNIACPASEATVNSALCLEARNFYLQGR